MAKARTHKCRMCGATFKRFKHLKAHVDALNHKVLHYDELPLSRGGLRKQALEDPGTQRDRRLAAIRKVRALGEKRNAEIKDFPSPPIRKGGGGSI